MQKAAAEVLLPPPGGGTADTAPPDNLITKRPRNKTGRGPQSSASISRLPWAVVARDNPPPYVRHIGC